MKDLVERLNLALEKDCEIYEEILRLGEKKKKIIISGEIEELDRITKREHALIASLMKLEEIRDKLISEIMKKTGLTVVKELDDVIAVIAPQYQAQLLGTKNKLGHIMQDVRTVNESNGSLIKQSLDIIEFNINLMTSVGDTETSYGKKADINYQNGRRPGFDAKV